MFRFSNPHSLYFLIVIPIMVLLDWYGVTVQRKRLKAFGNPQLLKLLMPNVSYIRPHIKFAMLMLALILLVFALARPQFGTKLETNKREGVEAMIVLDVSNSMLARDIQPNRLEYAKMILSKLIDEMNDDKIGLIVFAGDAFIQMPITSDNVSAKMFLSSITTNSVQRPGTAIGTAIDLAIKSFGDKETEAGRTIILLTDAENHEDDAVGAAKLAASYGITVNVIGLGRPEGEPIPIEGTMSFRKDKSGNVVVSKLNESLAQEIAKAGNGVYVRADNSSTALKVLTKEINALQKGDIETKAYTDYDERYFVFAWLALILLIIEFFVLNRQNKQLNRINWFD